MQLDRIVTRAPFIKDTLEPPVDLVIDLFSVRCDVSTIPNELCRFMAI